MFKSILLTHLLLFSLQIFSQDKMIGHDEKKISTTVLQVSFSGKVTDAKTGEPLVGASIYFSELKLGGNADNSGKFQINDVPAGHHLIEVSHVGYTSAVEHIDIDKNTEKNFALQPSVIENQGVIVTGVSNATN